ncbi:MAG TPA: ASCH domain-containing protein [Phycisphaerae bacterium]|nr:ASCH domain-containing protein [Phycisphaerae bacterium]
MLLLKRHLVTLVREGKKRQTIRLWTRPLLRPGQISYTPGLGRMLITAVDILPSLEALTEADARADGFASLRELRGEITRIYGPRVKGRTIYRIRFDWPIDAAGAALVLESAAASATASRPAARSSRIQKIPSHSAASRKPRRQTRMTPVQRQTLRRFILENVPPR